MKRTKYISKNRFHLLLEVFAPTRWERLDVGAHRSIPLRRSYGEMIDATGQDTLFLRQRLGRWLVPWRRSREQGVEDGGWREGSLAGCRECVQDIFV